MDAVTVDRGSTEMRSLYLDADRSGVAWLLDPDNQAVADLARAASARTRESPCDPAALAADLSDLDLLLHERHFGVADGVLDPAPASEVLARWRDRLLTQRPGTWGAALGTSVHELRWLFRDNHLYAAGEDRDLLASIDPRASDPRTEREPGPVVTESVVDGVLCLRIRQCGGLAQSSEDLMRAWQNEHPRHFRHERIIVDLRANPGGDDRYMIGWIRDHVRRDVVWPAWREWRINDVPANLWNVTVFAAVDDTGALSTELDRARYLLGPSSQLHVVEEPEIIPTSPTPWAGRMLVLTDKGSASAAESAAWMLRTGLDAKIVGARSAGAVGFGNITYYLLPRSGLSLDLPTASSGWYDESMVGMPVDLNIDVHQPLHEIAEHFNAIHTTATTANTG